MSGICSVHSPKTTEDCAACNAVTDFHERVRLPLGCWVCVVFAEDWNSKEDAVYDAPAPTPERRWRAEEGYLYTPAGTPVADFVAEDAESDLVLATLNEAEDLRADAEAHRRGSDGHGCDEYIPDHAFSGAAFEGIGCEHCGRKRERHALADDRETLRAEVERLTRLTTTRTPVTDEHREMLTALAEADALRERVRVLESLVKTAAALIAAHESEEIGAEFKVASAAYEEARALAGAEPPDAGEMLGGLLREQASRKWAGAETEAGR